MRALTFAALALLVASQLAACGDDSSGSSTPRAEAEAEVEARNQRVRKEYRERREAEAPTAEERRAERTAAGFYAILRENLDEFDSAAFCALMSARAKERTIAYAKQTSVKQGRWDCERAIELLVAQSKRTGGLARARKAKVIGVNVEGGRATASVRFGDGPVGTIPLVRENGAWKLATAPPVADR